MWRIFDDNTVLEFGLEWHEGCTFESEPKWKVTYRPRAVAPGV